MVGMLGRFYLAGLALGVSVCFVKCAVLLFPLVARFGSDWKEGLRMGLGFGAGKMVTYALLGALASFSGTLLEDLLWHPAALALGAACLVGLGAWFFWRESACFARPWRGRLPVFFLGAVYGFVPCPPLAGFLLYLAWQETGVPLGALSGLFFGLGTMSGPILIICGIFPLAGERIRRRRGAEMALRAIGAGVFFWWAGQLFF